MRLAGNGCVAAPTPTDVAAGAEPFYMTKFVSIPRDTVSCFKYVLLLLLLLFSH